MGSKNNQTRGMPRELSREASLAPSTYNERDNTIDLVWSTGARVRRDSWFDDPWDEELSLEGDAVRLGRLNKGASLLDSHDTFTGLRAVIGAVVPGSARLAPGAEHGLEDVPTVGVATVRLSARPDLEGIVSDIRSGIIRHVSIGYSIEKWSIVRASERADGGTVDLYRADQWEPYEISFVPVAADADAQSRSHPSSTGSGRRNKMKRADGGVEFPKAEGAVFAAGGNVYWNGEFATMNPEDTLLGTAAAEALLDADIVTVTVGATAPAADAEPAAPAGGEAAADPVQTDQGRAQIARQERERIAAIQTRGTALGAKPDVVRTLVDAGTDIEAATRQLFAAVATAQERTMTHPHTPTMPGDTDHRVQRAAAMVRALLHRANASRYKVDADSRNYAGHSLVRLAEEYLRESGVDTRGMSPTQIAQRALSHRSAYHTSSDFPLILADVATKSLRDAYELAPRTFEPFVRRTTLPDFKEVSRVQLGEAPSFLPVPEGGEYEYATIGEGREKYKLAKSGRLFAVTWETLINDDLDAFSRIPAMYGDSAANQESDLVWGILTGNPAMADGEDLFSAPHGNVGTAAALVDHAPVSAMRSMIRLQKGLDGTTPLALVPSMILLPVELEGVWAQISGPLYASTPGNSVPGFIQSLTPVVEPRLSDANPLGYFVACAPDRIDTIELGSLAGEVGIHVETRDAFERDGLEIKARIVRGAKAIDHRWIAYNEGAEVGA